MMPPVPPRHASVNIHKKRRSSTIATNFQSSITCSRVGVGKSETKKEKGKRGKDISNERLIYSTTPQKKS